MNAIWEADRDVDLRHARLRKLRAKQQIDLIVARSVPRVYEVNRSSTGNLTADDAQTFS
jgi:hypothetical protein